MEEKLFLFNPFNIKNISEKELVCIKKYLKRL